MCYFNGSLRFDTPIGVSNLTLVVVAVLMLKGKKRHRFQPISSLKIVPWVTIVTVE